MLRRLPLAVAGGAALWLSFPDINLWLMAPLGIALLALSAVGTGLGRGFLLGFLGGAAWFIPYVSWTGLHVGWLPWFALAFALAFFVGVFTMSVAALHRRQVLLRPVATALVWTGLEWVRSVAPFGGFPWGRVAFSQADSPLAGLAALGGPAAVGFAVALIGALLGRAGHAMYRLRPPRAVAVPAVTAVLLLMAPLLIPLPTDGPSGQFMAIQGNAPQTGLDFNAKRRQILDNHGRVSELAAAQIASGARPAPDLVVWPENASDIDPFLNPDAGAVIDRAVADLDAPLLVGAVLAGPGEYVSNTSLLYLPGHGPTQRYVKRRPVPFAEFMPYRDFFRAITRKVDLLERDFVAGDKVGLMRIPNSQGPTIAAGLGICFEVAIEDVLQEAVHSGANVLIIQTNNAMFDLSAESAQQLAISRIRAIEFGRSVVHSSNVGISALITPDGVAHQATQMFEPAIIQGRLPLRSELTLAARLGPWPDRLTALVALVLVAAALRPTRRRGSRQAPR
ncbi:apolipoprotein N-acyltransferase [Gephyromycinifex aptenodytis]|uniref:apolipoprotein N-acyltransferase n=1 Tax=Gephyromycinifex aptenodytis TaxID=2716227 RepID=UPI0014450CA1|nr:apolipoprotein N-acyltransferase [Gephyromycinifex aptenodytis]